MTKAGEQIGRVARKESTSFSEKEQEVSPKEGEVGGPTRFSIPMRSIRDLSYGETEDCSSWPRLKWGIGRAVLRGDGAGGNYRRERH